MKDRVLRDFTRAGHRQDRRHLPHLAAGRGYEDVKGFCYSASLDDLRRYRSRSPWRYVGAEDQKEDAEVSADKRHDRLRNYAKQFLESAKLEGSIKKNLAGLAAGKWPLQAS